MKDNFEKGSYGYDVRFFQKNRVDVIELKNPGSPASVLIVPDYQGRVMTSSAEGDKGQSFGWINYALIESGVKSEQFNPFGGEERLWLGPEGGPFSIYFSPGAEQDFHNWKVPAVIDTEPFDVVSQSSSSVSFKKDFEIVNALGTALKVGIHRKVTILDRESAGRTINLPSGNELAWVAYESENSITNNGNDEWDSETGVLSIWMLSMFIPSEKGVVVIPYNRDNALLNGMIVNDNYFGKVPADRLVVRDGNIFFKTDGKYRSKIGLPPERALPYCGSYDPESRTLTLLWYSLPESPAKYVNSKWGKQEDPFDGDVVNSYNDGPLEDGSVMGPFYEIESSSPAAFLSAGGKITHLQRIFHITGEERLLDEITMELFGVTTGDITRVF